jgi:hypothetical protein
MEGDSMGAQVGDRNAVKMSQARQLDRVNGVLEILEAGDEPRYDFRLHGTGTVDSTSSGASATIVSLEHGRS